MIHMELNLEQFRDLMEEKKCICFGSGAQGIRLIQIMENWGITDHILFYADNNKSKWGMYVEYAGFRYPIRSIKEMTESIDNDTVIAICCLDFTSVYEQLDAYRELDKVKCVSLSEIALNQLKNSDYQLIEKKYTKPVIPKKIHYCWFGGEIPDYAKKNIDSWYRMCPNYEIIKWDESNYDYTKNKYMREAYKNKCWGFVPDYARLDVVYNYGGIYLDTDVEIVNNLDELLYQDGFMSCSGTLMTDIGSGIGAVPNNHIVKELRDYYDNVSFIESDGKLNKLSALYHTHNVLKNHNFIINDELQSIEGVNIYPMIFQGACASLMEKRVTEKTYFVHYGANSWMGDDLKNARKKSVEYMRKNLS